MTQEMAPLDICEARELTVSAIPRAPTEAHQTVKPRLAIAVFLLVCVFCMLASYLGQHSHGVATIWLSNGLLFAILIRQPRSTWPAYLLIGYCADALGACIGDRETFLSSMIVSACNTLEVALTAFLLHRWFGSSFKLSRPRPLFAFFGTGVILAPAVACALASLCLSIADHDPWLASYRTWFLGDALGMAIVAPLVFVAQEPEFLAAFRRKQLPKTLLILLVPILATLSDFGQSQYPFPLLIMPSLIFVTFRRGFPGVVMAVFLTACVAILVTLSGRGLMTLTRYTDPLQHIVAVQIFIAVTLFAIFPIAALLEESRSLGRSLQLSELRYRTLANTDPLTGQANRRAFEERIAAAWSQCAEEGQPLALLALDVDFFKSYNDIYGHIAGDDCLRHIAAVAAETLHQRTSARLYRLGGEEFAILLPHEESASALTLAELIRTAVHAAGIQHKGTPLGRQTISIGVATVVPHATQSPLSLIDSADKALYRAKANGRNRCEFA